jgi:hypothetical protein
MQLMMISARFFKFSILSVGLLVGGCAFLLPPVTADQVRKWSNEDLKGALYLTGGTQDFMWQFNEPDRAVVVDEIQSRKIMNFSQISQLINKGLLDWPKMDQSRTDVLLAVGEPDSKSNDGVRETWTYNLHISGKLFTVNDTRTVCFRDDRVLGRTLHIDHGDGNTQYLTIDC